MLWSKTRAVTQVVRSRVESQFHYKQAYSFFLIFPFTSYVSSYQCIIFLRTVIWLHFLPIVFEISYGERCLSSWNPQHTSWHILDTRKCLLCKWGAKENNRGRKIPANEGVFIVVSKAEAGVRTGQVSWCCLTAVYWQAVSVSERVSPCGNIDSLQVLKAIPKNVLLMFKIHLENIRSFL